MTDLVPASKANAAQFGHAPTRAVRQPAGPGWFLAGGACLLSLAAVILGARVLAFESLLALAAAALSADGIVEASNRRAFAALLIRGAAFAALSGIALIALSSASLRRRLAAAVAWDPLRRLGLDVPNAFLVVSCSAVLGALAVGAWVIGAQIGGPLRRMYVKEGPFELVTVALVLASVAFCIAAARRWKEREPPQLRSVPALYVALGIGLSLLAAEELNWGQTLLGFETPAQWAEINDQRETSLHNLLDGEALVVVTRVFVLLFGAVAIGSIALAVAAPRSIFAAIAPPASLVVLGAFVVYGGARLYAEVLELLLAIFFTFYTYRIYVAARSSARRKLPSA